MTIFVFISSLLGLMALGMPIAFALIGCGLAMMFYMGVDRSADRGPEHVGRRQQLSAAGGALLHARRRVHERRRHVAAHHHAGHGLGRPHPRRPRLRGGRRRGHHGVALGLGGRRHRGDRRAADSDDAQRRLQRAALVRPDRLRRHHRAGDPAVDRHDPVRRHRRRLDHQAVHRRHRPGRADGRCRSCSPGGGGSAATR